MKVPKSHFVRFKKAFKIWQNKLSLGGYRVVFDFCLIEDCYADIEIDEPGKIVVVRLSSKMYKDNNSPELHAKHEALHLLLHRIGWLGERRWTGSSEINLEEEHLVRVLEKVL